MRIRVLLSLALLVLLSLAIAPALAVDGPVDWQGDYAVNIVWVDGKVIPVPDTFDYKQWLGSTKEVPYTKDRTHDQTNVDSRPGWLRLNQFTHGMITGWGAHHVDIAHWAWARNIPARF